MLQRPICGNCEVSTAPRFLDRIETHLTSQPTLQSRSRIKRLRAGTYPPYRLRVDDIRVYYDVDEAVQLVVVLGIVPKSESAAWLAGPIDQVRLEDDW
jgi:mRNA-degrading endonuclease RelE of RelBE toxin-antitoxin system